MLAQENTVSLQFESKFHGHVGRFQVKDQDYWLLIPTTYMNHSGTAVKSLSYFYKIPPEAILIAHDELDFPAGTIRLKQNGGHGGHNGIRDIIQHLHNKNFHRLRIGIGHPGHRDQVLNYVLSRPSKKDFELIQHSFESAKLILPLFLAGNFQQAVQQLHNR